MDSSTPRSKLSIWMQAIRPFSFTASLVPVSVGAIIGLCDPVTIRWELFPLVVICSLLLHAGTNLLNDYSDFEKGVDKEDTYGSSRVLVEGLLESHQVLKGSIALLALGFLLALILVAIRGIPMLVLSLIGLLGGYLYSGKPFAYKYKALGDVMVFILMGPLMVIGSYFALTGDFFARVFYVSLPIGFLVTAILHGNNLRDITYDKRAHVKTLAGILGYAKAKMLYRALISVAYLVVVLLVIMRVVSSWSLTVFLTLPLALKNIKSVNNSKPNEPQSLALIDIETAQLHFLFGLLLILSFFVSCGIA
ncbi:MAG: 1,4-dihydroxy-2-naphthoate octaprenyltransferase [Candidatus Omnitrophota bacterium]|nr:MAG: 1,4-dihydroxy-2-naphthoate octaprenyltransferase [Candidatus Omnitrophota bacterium]